MTYEKQLDIALEFLLKQSRYTDGSYLYYDNIKSDSKDINFKNNPEIKEEDTMLVVYLKKKMVLKNIIYIL